MSEQTRKMMNVMESALYHVRFMPAREYEPGSFEIDPTYDGDAFELTKDQARQLDMKKASVKYYSDLFGYSLKRDYIYTHPEWNGYMIAVE